MLGKIEGGKRKEQQRMKWLEGITDSMHIGSSKFQELVMYREAWHAANPWHRRELDTPQVTQH